jgi:hypothetical protein
MSEKTEKKPRVQKDGVGKLAQELILAGGTNEDVFKEVKAKFPEAKTSMASINWYRNKLRSDGKDVKTSREIRAAAKKDPLEA